jgi:cell shape-determining protein MreC
MPDGTTDDGGTVLSRLQRVRAAGFASRREVAELREAVAELQEEMQEARRLNRRLAEITDIVEELLLPAAQRDETRLRERLESYASSL